MNYIVYDGKFDFDLDDYSGKVFATLEEAQNYANLITKETRIILTIEKTEKEITHSFIK
ncbi:MAG: hypothetical protein MJ174_07395 [Treponema sp.]|nr:hypothetical protein [Treponema sp.]